MVKALSSFYSRSAGGQRLLLTFICLLWFGVLALRAADYYVATNGTDNPTCTDWTTPASNIQYAVDLAIGEGDTVWVSNGSYCVTNQITITNKITVRSTNGYASTLVYADWPFWTTRCFYVSRTGTVDGFTISNGHYWASNNYDGGGGALLTNGTIQNCYFSYNVCSNPGRYVGGGGLYIKNGTVSNCTFFTNTSMTYIDPWGGGGIMINAQTYANILSCRIISNKITSGRGAGIHCDNTQGALPFISNCTFEYNSGGSYRANYSAKGYMVDCGISNHPSGSEAVACWQGGMRNCVVANNSGGGVHFTYGGSATNCTFRGNSKTTYGAGASMGPEGTTPSVLERCTFSNNICTAGAGGGGVGMSRGNGGFGILRNCLIHNNTNTSATGYGGGVFLTNAAISRTSMVINCTIVNNYSTNEGGGIGAAGLSNYIVNCVIANNSSSSGNYPNVYYQDNLDANKSNFYYCCAVTTGTYLAENQGNITNDPVFAGASADNWRLAANSPCINKGTNQNWMTNAYDLDGRTRIRYGTVDMGAYERIHDGTIYGF